MSQPRYTLGELAEQAGITVRTIRYYTTEGVLPPPDTRGRYAVYSHEHLQRLRLITQLKLAHLPLSEIRFRLTQLSATEVEQLLREGQVGPPDSAVEYLSQLLDPPAAPRPSTRMLRERFAEQEEPYAPMIEARSSAQDQITPARPEMSSRAERLPSMAPSFLNRREQPSAPPAAPVVDIWQHIVLAPGIELHIRSTEATQLNEQIRQIVVLAQQLFHDKQR